MDEQTETAHEECGNRKKRAAALAGIAACMALLAIAAIVALPAISNAAYDESAQSGKMDGASYDEIVANLDESARQSRLWISVASPMQADSKTGAVHASDAQGQTITVLDNRAENSVDLKYAFSLEDGTVIYESGLIKPGQSIASPALDAQLVPGAYDVTVTAQGYDVESHTAVGGTVAAQATLNVD